MSAPSAREIRPGARGASVPAAPSIDGEGLATRAQAASRSAQNVAAPKVQQLGEAVEFIDAASTLARATAKAQDASLASSPRVVQLGEATNFVDPAGARSRAEVLAEARAASNLSIRAGSHTVH